MDVNGLCPACCADTSDGDVEGVAGGDGGVDLETGSASTGGSETEISSSEGGNSAEGGSSASGEGERKRCQGRGAIWMISRALRSGRWRSGGLVRGGWGGGWGWGGGKGGRGS